MNLPANDAPDEGGSDGSGSGGSGSGEGASDERANTASAADLTGTAAGRAAITRRKLDEIFGDVLPTTTRDERDEGRDPGSRDNDERWYRDNRPPHHG